MKNVILVLFTFLTAVSHAQQSNIDNDIDSIQNRYGQSKAELVKQYMRLNDADEQAFQNVYVNYELKRKELGKQRLQIIESYAENYASLTDEKANAIAKDILKNNISLDKLNAKTYNKCKAVLGAKNAAKFMQLESYLQNITRGEMQEVIPFIGEIELSKKK